MKELTSNGVCLLWLEEFMPYLTNLVIPIILLLIYSALKYTVAKGRSQILWLDMSVEVPVDFLCIACTLVITNFIFFGNTKIGLVVGIILLLLTIFVAWCGCLLRAAVLEFHKENNPSKKRILFAIALYVLVALWLSLVIWIGNILSISHE